jgi:acyl-CoA synthetase (AMP-forming)/AMP-acid ligase II
VPRRPLDLRVPARPARLSVPPSILDRAETIDGALDALVDLHGDTPCLTFLDRDHVEQRVTPRSIQSHAQRAHALFADRGLEPGQVVVIALQTGLDLVGAYFGALYAGGIPALVAPPSNRVADLSLYRERLAGVMCNARAGVFFCSSEIAAVVRDDEAVLAPGTALATPDDLPECGLGDSARPKSDDVATVQYSSGSTGAPKGVLLTHRAILANLCGFVERLELSADDVSVNWVPLYHDMGLIDTFLLPLLRGYPAVLIPTMEFLRDPSLWLWALHHYRGTISFAPNFAYALCAKRVSDRSLEGLDLSSWRLAVASAEPVLAETCLAFSRRFEAFGFHRRAFTAAYGMAEFVTAVTMDGPDDELAIESVDRSAVAAEGVARLTKDETGLCLVGVGRCLVDTELEIRDEARNALPDREIGTIWFRGSSLFSGYRDDPELTARSLVDGWLESGDRGYVVGDRLFFVSREKDLIVVGGEKYAPHDIETVANSVRGVREGCVVAFGVMNPDRGTEEVAVVAEVRTQDPDELDALRRAIRNEIVRETGLGVRHLVLVQPGGVQKTTSGKLARSATRDRYAGEFES